MKKRNQCLKLNRTADGSAYLNMNTAPKESTLEPYDIPGAPSDTTPINTPITEPPIQVTPVTPKPVTAGPTPDTTTPVLPASPTDPMPFSDPSVEMDYYSVSCKVLSSTMSYIQNKLTLIKNAEQNTYYNNRLADIQKAYSSLQCQVPDIVDINNPATVTNPDAGTGATTTAATQTTTTPAATSTTTVVTPAPASAAGGAAGGGGGGGGSDDPAKPVPAPAAKKRNWWLIGGCILAIAVSIYMDRKEAI